MTKLRKNQRKIIENSLPVGTMVQEYKIIEVLGNGSFGIVYSAENKYFSEIVAIKEFLPQDLAYRSEGESNVRALSSQTEEAYTYARNKFLQEAKNLRELGRPDQHPNIVRVRQFIEANDTAYLVMDFEKGQPLIDILKERGPLPEKELKDILCALLDGLERVHSAFVWHRDIKPSNILIRPDGSPVLIDFGAARKDISGKHQSKMVFFSPAYAAPEQLYPVGAQGPWTDIYSLGATAYRAVTGNLPANRMQNEVYVTAVEAAQGRYCPMFLAAIDAALQLYPNERPQSIDQWRTHFAQMPAEEPLTLVRPTPDADGEPDPGNQKRKIKLSVVFGAAAMVALMIFGVFYPTINREPQMPAAPAGASNSTTAGNREPVVVSEAPRLQTQLKITSIPSAAQVFVNGNLKGVTPLDMTTEEGIHLLRLSLEGHYDWESKLLIEMEGSIPIQVPLLVK